MIDCGYNSKVSAQNRFFTNSVSAAPAGFSAQRGGAKAPSLFLLAKTTLPSPQPSLREALI